MKKSTTNTIPVMEVPEKNLELTDKIRLAKRYAAACYCYNYATKENLKDIIKMAHKFFTTYGIMFPYLTGCFKAINIIHDKYKNEQDCLEISRKELEAVYDSIK